MILKESYKKRRERFKRENALRQKRLEAEKKLAAVEKRLQELKTVCVVMQPKRDYNINGTRARNFMPWAHVLD